jgi:hypothetical protein
MIGRYAAKNYDNGLKYGRRCFICLKALDEVARIANTRLADGSHRLVELDTGCYTRVTRAAHEGVRAGKGLGPLVFASQQMADAYAMREFTESPPPTGTYDGYRRELK